MKPKVYIETTVVSYLVARPSADVILAAHQQITREWWERRGTDFEFFVSSLVMQEAGSGDPEAARLRLEKLSGMPVLLVTDEAETLAYDLAHGGPSPESAAEDALHIALATVHGLPVDMELPAHRERRDPTRSRIEMPGPRVRVPRHLHAGRTYGRLRLCGGTQSLRRFGSCANSMPLSSATT